MSISRHNATCKGTHRQNNLFNTGCMSPALVVSVHVKLNNTSDEILINVQESWLNFSTGVTNKPLYINVVGNRFGKVSEEIFVLLSCVICLSFWVHCKYATTTIKHPLWSEHLVNLLQENEIFHHDVNYQVQEYVMLSCGRRKKRVWCNIIKRKRVMMLHSFCFY